MILIEYILLSNVELLQEYSEISFDLIKNVIKKSLHLSLISDILK